jgi:arginyl-tRNA synthetase
MKVRLTGIIHSAVVSLSNKWSLKAMPDILCQAPKHRNLGDLSTNVAMQVCKLVRGLSPMKAAEDIVEYLKVHLSMSPVAGLISRIEVKPPGFINFYFSGQYLRAVINEIGHEGDDFGRGEGAPAQKGQGPGHLKNVLIEFVSANPTGPLSVAHGRQAAAGDAIANILEFAGHKVTREYYLNDKGNQILILGRSIHARYCELIQEPCPFPENGYKGSYIVDIARIVVENQHKGMIEPDDKNIRFFCDFGVNYIMQGIKKDLLDFGVRFDNYYSQQRLEESGNIEKVLKWLDERSLLYEKEGALWFSSTRFGDDKDRVLRKSDGSYTYITPDIAYHKDKFKRGFDLLIDLWGPDHHGYINRIKAACQAMGKDPAALFVLIIQLVTICRDGLPVRMSTREGEFISLREVMDEVGTDVARFFFLTRRRDSHLDFDLELAKKESMENPVYYIQYAHARICGILGHGDKQGNSGKRYKDKDKDKILSLLNSDEELCVMRLLREFPDTIQHCATNLEPHKLISYLIELAGSFHGFYAKHRVISDDKDLTSARLMLIGSIKKVLSKALTLLGVSVPEKM